MRIRLKVDHSLGAAGDLVACDDASARKLIARRVAEPAKPARKRPPKKKAAPPSEG
jgi:hypothetical protein